MTRRNSIATGLLAALIVVNVAALAGVGLERPAWADSQAMILPVDPHPLVALTSGGGKSFSVEIADDENEREAGLMFRKTMADDHGMLFVFEQSQPVGFWMKNTVMPLDLIFIGQDGRIKAIKHGEPQSEAIITPGQPVRFVLELKAGTAARAGIREGDLVKHPVIAGASMPSEPPPAGMKGDAPNKAGTAN